MSIINNMPQKGGAGINGIIEQYYVAAGEIVNAGDFVEYIEGVSGLTDLESYAVTTTIGHTIGGVLLADGRIVVLDASVFKAYVCRIDDYGVTKTTTTALENNSIYGIEFMAIWEDNIIFCVTSSTNSKYLKVHFFEVLSDDSIILLATALDTSNNMFTLTSYGDITFHRLGQGSYFCTATSSGSSYTYPVGVILTITFDKDAATATIATGTNKGFANSSGYDNSNIRVGVTEDYIYVAYHNNKYSDRFYMQVLDKAGNEVIAQTYISTSCTSVVSVIPITQEKMLVITSHSDGRSVCELTCNLSSSTITLASTNIFDNSDVYYFQTMEETEEEIWYMCWRGIYMIPYNKSTGFFGTSVLQSVTASNYLYCSAFRGVQGNQYVYSFPLSFYSSSSAPFPLKRFWYENRTLTNALSEQIYETQVQSTVAEAANGVAKSGGTGGNEYGHKDIIEIYVPGTTT